MSDNATKPLARTKATVILVGLALLVLGVAMFVHPIGATLLIVKTVGWTLVIVGAFTLLNCCMHRSELLRSVDLAIGFAELIAGALMVAMPDAFVAVVFEIIGVIILVTGINDITDAGIARRLGVPGSAWRTVLGVLTVIAGIGVICSPFMLADFVMLLAGIALIFAGITEIIAGAKM